MKRQRVDMGPSFCEERILPPPRVALQIRCLERRARRYGPRRGWSRGRSAFVQRASCRVFNPVTSISQMLLSMPERGCEVGTNSSVFGSHVPTDVTRPRTHTRFEPAGRALGTAANPP